MSRRPFKGGKDKRDGGAFVSVPLSVLNSRAYLDAGPHAKAQSQCRATLETLAAIKNPPVVFARQANIAHGHQQINNGAAAPSHAEEIESEQTRLSGVSNELLPDARSSRLASKTNQTVETLGKIDRAKVRRR